MRLPKPQFGLRTLLVVTALAAVGSFAVRARYLNQRQAAIVRSLRNQNVVESAELVAAEPGSLAWVCMPEEFSDVVALQLRGSHLRDEHLWVLQFLPRLRELQLNRAELTPALLEDLHHLRVDKLTLSGCEWKRADALPIWEALAQMPRLRTLEISGPVTDQDLANLPPSLESLTLDDSELSTLTTDHLRALPKLRHLTVTGDKSPKLIELNHAGLKGLQIGHDPSRTHPELEARGYGGGNNERALDLKLTCPQLETLALHLHCVRPLQLVDCPSLISLKFRRCTLLEWQIANAPRLQDIEMFHCNIAPHTLAEFAHAAQLKSLRLRVQALLVPIDRSRWAGYWRDTCMIHPILDPHYLRLPKTLETCEFDCGDFDERIVGQLAGAKVERLSLGSTFLYGDIAPALSELSRLKVLGAPRVADPESDQRMRAWCRDHKIEVVGESMPLPKEFRLRPPPP